MKEGLFTFVSAIAVQRQNWPLTRLIKPACALATSYKYPSYSSSIHPFQLCFPIFSGVGLNFSCIYCLSFLFYLHLSCLLEKHEWFFFESAKYQEWCFYLFLYFYTFQLSSFPLYMWKENHLFTWIHWCNAPCFLLKNMMDWHLCPKHPPNSSFKFYHPHCVGIKRRDLWEVVKSQGLEHHQWD